MIPAYPDSKVHGAHPGPTWGRRDPAGPHVGPMKLLSAYLLCVTYGSVELAVFFPTLSVIDAS